MNVAYPLSVQINAQHIPNLNDNASDQAIAADMNLVDPIINQYLHVNVPPLNGSSIKGLSVLVTPFDDFLNASASVKQDDPGSACNFIAAMVVLATDVTVLVGGTLAITVVIALVNVAVQYCDTACILTATNNASNFIAEEGSQGLKDAWAAHCAIPGQCTSTITTTSTTPEFPVQLVGLLLFSGLAVAAFLARSRYQGRRNAHR